MAIKFSKEQQLAIDSKNQNIIVSAGAGSGKTAVLTQRIKKILLSGIKANQLLVLTFTNPAAREMKERIMKAMQADENLKNRISEVDNAYITTFDSFALSMVKKYHDRLNVSRNIEIIDKSVLNVYKRNVLNNIFNELYQKEDEKFLDLIYKFSIKNDNTLKKDLLNLAEKLDNVIDKESYLNNYLNNFYNQDKFKEWLDQWKNLFDFYLKELTRLLEIAYTTIPNKRTVNSLKAKYQQFLSSTCLEEYYTFKPTLPSNKVYPICIEIKYCTEKILNLLFAKSYEEMEKQYFSTQPFVEVVLSILKQFYQKVDEFKYKNETFEFIDIAKMAIFVVKNNEDIKNELKYSFKEILVDEYQDTNDLQEEFINLIANNNVYMVGDIKQSIYGFRNANPMNFKNKYDAYKNHQGGMKIDLNQNFRSNRKVLNVINKIFNRIMDDEIGNANFIEDHQMNFGLKDYEKRQIEQQIKYVSYLKDTTKIDQQTEMFYVLHDIQTKIENKELVYDKELGDFRECTYKDFAILMSDSTLFNELSLLFEYYHIPNLVFKNISIFNGNIVFIFKNIVKLIILDYKKTYNEAYKASFYGVARSFLFNMQDEEIFDFITSNTINSTPLYQIIHQLSLLIKTHSLSNIIYEVIEQFNILNKLSEIGNATENVTKIEYIYQISKSMEKIDLNIFDFVEYIEDIIQNNDQIEYKINDKNENKVKIMTIHKSKGLEFPIVYFINNQKKFQISELKSNFIFSNQYGITVPFFDQGSGKTIAYFLNKEQYSNDMISEKIRLLYVALTRAREQIIILNNDSIDENIRESLDYSSGIVSPIIRKKYNSFKSIYLSIINEFNDCSYTIKKENINLHNFYLNFLKHDVEPFFHKNDKKITYFKNNINSKKIVKAHASKQQKVLITKHEVDLMNYGTKIHSLFETCDFKNYNPSLYTDYENQLIQQFLSSSLMANIKNGNIYKEFEFIENQNNQVLHGIIDLMIEYDDHIDIIDYKLSNIEDQAYLNQLNSYKNYIFNKKQKEVKTYLYSILTANIKEIK